ncbi:hypothetical protein, partial [Pseudomonas putida]
FAGEPAPTMGGVSLKLAWSGAIGVGAGLPANTGDAGVIHRTPGCASLKLAWSSGANRRAA